MIRRRFLRARDRLTGPERMDLLRGNRGAFASDAERRAAWERHRLSLLPRGNPGRRPAAFWDYEGPAELRDDALEHLARVIEPDGYLVEICGYARAKEIAVTGALDRRRRAWLARQGTAEAPR